MSFQNVNVKIDTGCPYSTIPIQRLNMSATQVEPYKRNDANKLVSDIQHHMKNGHAMKQAIQKELKNWNIHMGTIDTGETIFLGCPKDQIYCITLNTA